MKGFINIFRREASDKVWGYGIFWSWNIIFLAFMFFGFAPTVLPDTIEAVQDGVIPPRFLVISVLLALIPLIAVYLGLTLLRRSPFKLLTLIYGVEGPLMVLLLGRIYLVRDATPAIELLYAFSLIAVAALCWQLLDLKAHTRGLALDLVRIFGLTLLLLIGIYAGTVIAFYVVPLLKEVPGFFAEAARSIWSLLLDFTWADFLWILFSLLLFVLLLYTASLLIVAPIVVPVMYIRHWWRGLESMAPRRGRRMPLVLTGVLGTAAVLLFLLANRQPQHRAYELLKDPPQFPADLDALLAQQETIRDGLLNAYLSPVRYISAVGEVTHIRELYRNSFNLSNESAYEVEKAFEVVVRPLLYEPMQPPEAVASFSGGGNQRILRNEPGRAAGYYEAFFDESIVEGERETIVSAVRDTWSGEQALLAWQGVDDREVLLTEQAVTITEHGDWAEVELYESYRNETAQRQEVVYYFNLPETAVVTGLWLGNSPDREKRHAFQVAPRGAAQQAYREQVQIRVDPALLEQVGPRQYRLRIFPVEPPPPAWRLEEGAVGEAPQLYMWMTYTVLAQEGGWALPQLSEKANVYWDALSERQVNGEAVDGETEAWLPATVPAANPVVPAAHLVAFPSGQTVILRPAEDLETPGLPAAARLAVVLDRSRSMQLHFSGAAAALSQLQAIAPDADLYLTSSDYRGEDPTVEKLADIDPASVVYFGGQDAAQLLAQFFSLSAGRHYDAVFVLTDGSGYALGGGEPAPAAPDAPIWMVHLGGGLPLGYDDATLQAIQSSGGGVAASLDEALIRFEAFSRGSGQEGAGLRDIQDGYEWEVILEGESGQARDAISHDAGDPFAALAARRLILAEMYQARGQIDDLATLDRLHDLAKEYGIVTPYSSMIVLVNRIQDQRLEDLSGTDNRFEREGEEIGETVPAPFEVTGVPEPHEWLLLAIGAVLLAWYWYKSSEGLRGKPEILR